MRVSLYVGLLVNELGKNQEWIEKNHIITDLDMFVDYLNLEYFIRLFFNDIYEKFLFVLTYFCALRKLQTKNKLSFAYNLLKSDLI